MSAPRFVWAKLDRVTICILCLTAACIVYVVTSSSYRMNVRLGTDKSIELSPPAKVLEGPK